MPESTDASVTSPEGLTCTLPGCGFPAVRWATTDDGTRYPMCGAADVPVPSRGNDRG